MGIIDELKQNFKQGNYLIKLIFINIGIFVFVKLINLIFYLFTKVYLDEFFTYWLAFPSGFNNIITKPWTIITYMFMHASIWHLIFNLLWLYWFGQIFFQYLDQKKFLSVYLLGGIIGALAFAVVYNLFPAFSSLAQYSSLVGASAAIMAIVIAISAIVPDYSLNLLFFGPVKLKYIAIITIVIDVISIPYSNAGGYISHIGGAVWGYVFAMQYKKGHDISKGFSKFIDFIFTIFKPKKRMKVTYKKPVDDYDYNKQKADDQKEIDRILDKIAKGGYESLSKKEKDFLFRSGR